MCQVLLCQKHRAARKAVSSGLERELCGVWRFSMGICGGEESGKHTTLLPLTKQQSSSAWFLHAVHQPSLPHWRACPVPASQHPSPRRVNPVPTLSPKA